jgi:heterodisulfide reductase subunit B
MNATEAINTITDTVKKALRIKLAPGEVCPCCGHKKGSRKVSEKMLAANRRNLQLAVEAIKKK